MTEFLTIHTSELTPTRDQWNPETLLSLSKLPLEALLIMCCNPSDPTTVRFVNGKYYILDGNHRHNIITKKGGAKIEVVLRD